MVVAPNGFARSRSPEYRLSVPSQASSSAAAAVGDAVGAGGMPAHPDEEWSVVAVVGGPPVLGIRHQLEHVALERFHVELAEFLRVVEVIAHRAGLWRGLLENRQVNLIGPPVLVRQGPMRLRGRRGDSRVFAFAAARRVFRGGRGLF